MKIKLQLFLIRWRHASGRPLSPSLQRACERDPRLAAERDAEQLLTSALRTSAAPDSIEPSPYLAGRIKRSLQTESTAESRSSAPAWSFVSPGAFASVSLVALAALAWFMNRAQAPDPARPTTTLAASKESLPTTSTAHKDLITTAVVDATSAVMGDTAPWANPLRQELSHMLSDAQGAVRFLASNFLPSEIINTPSAQKILQPTG